uniref:Uncharacterized protein n=1 Tax=Sphaerodactylus townsendi TaxID=933632 RepID=A0ACB8G1W4_9SAUR
MALLLLMLAVASLAQSCTAIPLGSHFPRARWVAEVLQCLTVAPYLECGRLSLWPQCQCLAWHGSHKGWTPPPMSQSSRSPATNCEPFCQTAQGTGPVCHQHWAATKVPGRSTPLVTLLRYTTLSWCWTPAPAPTSATRSSSSILISISLCPPDISYPYQE